ncbi:MAG TPA: hypothetical protein PLF58_03135 [Smithella sp.]|jgi:hypothetical protein|nr:hypothetical protein [Smithella sp.]HNQ64481.1 hypothetical protein [Smithella sp.]HOG09570.1 hypothetical protein [Smithella sp.]HOS13633.1 hypothetical protein [Smithella sp.]HPL47971.1 hypothetical protein [Smithella sp.]
MDQKNRPTENQKHDYIIWAIRFLLIVSILTNIVFITLHLFSDDFVTKNEILEELSKRIELLFWSAVTLTLTFLPDYIVYKNIHLPHILEIVIVIFIFAGIFLSVRFELYYHVFWWDDVLHTLSGIIIGFLGFIIIYKINSKYSMDISPLLVAVFAFTFAMTMGVIWEIFEFALDVFFGTTMQSWDLPHDTTLIGRSFQGSGLRDTMSDLIVNSLGALLTSVICYFLYKREKKKTLALMQEIFPDE